MDSNNTENPLIDSDPWVYLDALQTITDTVGCALFSNQLFQTTLNVIVKVTHMDGAGFRIFDKDTNSFRLVAQIGITPELFDYLKSLPAENPLHSEVIKTHQPVIIADMTNDPKVRNKRILDLGHRSLICVPLLCGDELIGTFDLLSFQHYQWNPAEIRWLLLVGRILSLEIRHVQMQEKTRDISILEERQRISWEIHDNISHLVSSIRVRADTMEYLLETCDKEKLGKMVNEIAEIADDAYESLREEIIGLRGTLKGKGIVLTITEQLKRLERQWGIKANFELFNGNNEDNLPPRIELQILRIFQEAINNVRKHARATLIQVKLKEDHETVTLEITDNGQGFLVNNIEDEKHVGLRIMNERARSIGGNITILSAPGKGTKLTMQLPLKAEYYL